MLEILIILELAIRNGINYYFFINDAAISAGEYFSVQGQVSTRP